MSRVFNCSISNIFNECHLGLPQKSYQFVKSHQTQKKRSRSRNAHRHHGTLSLEVLDDLRGLPQRPRSSIGIATATFNTDGFGG